MLLAFLLIATTCITICKGYINILFHHSFSPLVNIEFDFKSVILADLETINTLKSECQFYNVCLEIKNIHDLHFDSFTKPLCDYLDKLSNPFPLSQSSPYKTTEVFPLKETDLYTIDIDIQKLIFLLNISEYHVVIKLENISSHEIIALSEINKPPFDPAIFANVNEDSRVQLLFHPSFQPVTDVYSGFRMILVAELEILRELHSHCMFLNAHVIIEAPGETYNVQLDSLCDVADEFKVSYPFFSSSYKDEIVVRHQRDLYFVEFLLANLIFDEEFGSIFRMEIRTIYGVTLVQSEKKVYYIFKANYNLFNEPKVALSINPIHFPETELYKEKVLISGGCGFLGRHFANRFCELGYLVFVIDDLEDSDSFLPDMWPENNCKENQLIFEQVDYMKYFQNDETFLDIILKIFIHVTSNRNVNTLDLDSAAFQFAARTTPNKMIYFSDSSLAYNDLDVLDSNFAFLLSKQSGERLADILFENYNVPVSIYRISQVYGSDQSSSNSPFISILNQVLEKREYPMNSRTITLEEDVSMDLVFVDDVVNCVMSTFHLAKSGPINLFSGETTSFSTLVKSFANLTGYKEDPTIYFLRHKKLKEIKSFEKDIIDEMKCQLPTTVVQGIKIVLQKYLENEKKKERNEIESKIIPINLYSSYKCLGGSQMFSDFKEQTFFGKFPRPGDPAFRVCHFKNVCLSGGKIRYFNDPQLQNLPFEYTVKGFHNNTSSMFEKIKADSFDWEIELENYPLSSSMVINQTAFIDYPVYSDSFGHILHDNVIPHFAAAKLFNLNIVDGQFIFHHPCSHAPHHINREKTCIDDLSKTLDQRCLENIKIFFSFFFLNPVLYLSEMEESKCYSDLVIGQGSTFSIYSLDLSRSLYISDFTQHIFNKYPILRNFERNSKRINILVALPGKKIENDFVIDTTVCERVRFCVESTPHVFQSSIFPTIPSVNCIVPENLSLLEQVITARKAHVIVSYDGSLAHIAILAQANTQHIVIKKSNVNDIHLALDSHIFLWTNHLHTIFVRQSVYYKEICPILLLSFKNYMAFM